MVQPSPLVRVIVFTCWSQVDTETLTSDNEAKKIVSQENFNFNYLYARPM